jgi:hypothetical protein
MTFWIAFLAAVCFLTYETAQAQERQGAALARIESTYVGGFVFAASAVFGRRIALTTPGGWLYLGAAVFLGWVGLQYYQGHAPWP